MGSSDDKHWASKYLLDPLNAPQPSEETGPGSHFRPPSASTAASTTTVPTPSLPNKLSRDPYRKGSISTKGLWTTTKLDSPTQSEHRPYLPRCASASPRQEQFSGHRQEALSDRESPRPRSSPSSRTASICPRRTSSLTSRFSGDKSHHPLAQLTAENRAADRAPHLRSKHHIPPDTIDSLDNVWGVTYHHSGPYDAVLRARNHSDIFSPVAALAESNAEALKATPREKILDSLRGHRPLDGVATYPPGATDLSGHVYHYEQGENMMTAGNPDGGAYKRWPGVPYHPDDIKGKGEPSYSVEKALKDHKMTSVEGSGKGHKKNASNETELMSRPRQSGDQAQTSGVAGGTDQLDGDNSRGGAGELEMGRGASAKEKRLSGGGLKKRFGNMKRHIKDAQILP